MVKFLKWFLIIAAIIAVIGYFAFQRMKVQTKMASPEDTVSFRMDDLKIDVTYSRPSKRGRDIFGALVPYGQVWRTGANEATRFHTNMDILVGSEPLPAGEYTLWTIPGQEEWSVLFNGQSYSWGVNIEGQASRDPQADVATVVVPVQTLADTVEQFTIRFIDIPASMILEWDDVQVSVPISW